MAYNYLGLVNEICAKVNEVPLTSANFSTEEGFYQTAKDAVNRAIDDINIESHFWRFNFTSFTGSLTAGVMRYSWPSDATVIDFDSFRIKESAVLDNATQFLKPINYDDYLQNWSQHEYYTDLTRRELPHRVVKTPGNDYIVVPSPDQDYDLVFDYYTQPEHMTTWDDVPTIPERYRSVIFTGAMRDIYLFREDEFSTEMFNTKFKEQIKKMRVREINLYDYVRSGMIIQNNIAGGLFYVK